MTAKAFVAYFFLLLLLILGLAACVPTPVISTSEASSDISPTPTAIHAGTATATTLPPDQDVQVEESGAPGEGNEILIIPTVAIAGGMIAGYRLNPSITLDSRVIYFGRVLIIQLSNVYALRMAGVFMLSLGTIWLRTGLMPRWLVILTYLLAASSLLIINLSLWVTLIFPAWVVMISIEILLLRLRQLTA